MVLLVTALRKDAGSVMVVSWEKTCKRLVLVTEFLRLDAVNLEAAGSLQPVDGTDSFRRSAEASLCAAASRLDLYACCFWRQRSCKTYIEVE